MLLTYLSLVIGELVPKRLGLMQPETVAMLVARPMRGLSRLAAPVVWLLGASTDLLLRLLGVRGGERTIVSEEEVKSLVREGMRTGALLPAESLMVERVLALDQIAVRQLMTPRAKVIWINQSDPHDLIWHKIVVSGHSTFPVYEAHRDNVVGLLSVKAIYAHLAAGLPVRVRDLVTPHLVVPASQSAVAVLETFRKTRKHFALVTDEFGGMAGLITLHDIMEAALGDFPSQDERLKPTTRRRDDGSWLIDAMIEVSEFEKQVPEFKLDPAGTRDYLTFAGYVVKRMGRLPVEGDAFEDQGFRVEVIDMDKHRVDKVLLMRLKPASSVATPPPADSRSSAAG
jgi:putative hemolysin